MKLTKDQFKNVPIFGSNQRPATPVTIDKLENAGVAFAAYGIGVGEVIEFPENASEHLFEQPTMVGGTNTQILVGCMRGRDEASMKPSYFAMGSLVRQDGNRQYTCDFTKEMGEKYGNHRQRLEVLSGKTIKGTEALEIEVVKFDRATRRPVTDASGATVLEKGKATKIEYVG